MRPETAVAAGTRRMRSARRVVRRRFAGRRVGAAAGSLDELHELVETERRRTELACRDLAGDHVLDAIEGELWRTLDSGLSTIDLSWTSGWVRKVLLGRSCRGCGWRLSGRSWPRRR
jgi:hypothetical protein